MLASLHRNKGTGRTVAGRATDPSENYHTKHIVQGPIIITPLKVSQIL